MPPKKKQDKDDDNERLDRIAIVEANDVGRKSANRSAKNSARW